MTPAAAVQPVLDQAEWELVVELLERERSQLLVEIHHTATRSYREQLRKRLDLAQLLLDRINPPK